MANELEISVQGDDLTIYALIRRTSDSKVWDVANTTWATWADGSIDDYDVALTSKDGDLYVADFPTDIIAGTRVRVHYYKQAGGTPAITDLLLATRDLNWNGAMVASGSSVTLDSDALTSLNSVKRYLRLSLSATTYDSVLTELINAISQKIQRFAGRNFVATDYYEWLTGRGQDQLVLKEWPVLRIHRIARTADDALSVAYSGNDIEATIEVSTANIYLRSLSAAGTTTATTLDFATYPTVSTLATAIAAVSGWTATVQSDTRAQMLCPTGAQAVKESGRSYNVDLRFASRGEDAYRFDSDTGVLARVYVNEPAGYSEPTIGGGAWQTNYNAPVGYRNLLIHYRAGYETLPADINQLANEMVQEAFHRGAKDGAIQSESLGSYSYTLADSLNLHDTQVRRLAYYSREAIA